MSTRQRIVTFLLIICFYSVPCIAQNYYGFSGYHFGHALVDLNNYNSNRPELETLERPLDYFIERCNSLQRFRGSNDAIFVVAIIDKILSDDLPRHFIQNIENKIRDRRLRDELLDIIDELYELRYEGGMKRGEHVMKRLLPLRRDEDRIFDFKPHYINRLAYTLNFRILRIFYDDLNYKEKAVRDGGYISDMFISGNGTAVIEANKNFFVFNLSDTKNISYDIVPVDTKTSNKYKPVDYSKKEKKQLKELKKKIPVPRSNYFSKYLYVASKDLLFISTDAGLHLYNTKSKKEIKFWRNFFTGNDIE